jgi:cell division septal protein FtsQ
MKPNQARNKRISNPRQRKQQHLLDVKLRASTERARRAQAIFGFLFKTALFIAVGVGAWLGGKEALRRYLWENPDYFLHEINFTTDGALTREQVLTASNIAEGRNIFTIDLGKAHAALEKMPQVESAVVQRSLPNRINITLTERRPIAWIAARGDDDPSSSDRSFMIDARAIVLRSRVLLPEYYHLPVISGFETENLVPGKRVGDPEIQAALELIRLTADNTRFQAQNIDVSKGYCLVTDQRRTKITFGLDHIDAELSRLYRCFDRATQDHKELQTVNLIVERNVPVTFADSEAPENPPAEQAPPKPPKATPTPEERPTPKPEVRKAEPITQKSSPKPSPKSAKSSTHGTNGNESLKKPFRLNP